MKEKYYRLGIIGTGRIAHRFVPEARVVDGIEVVAVYNPRLSSAEKFAEELKINFFTDDIGSFMNKVDAVYIATPHETHVDYCRQMLSAGKHVLCEKPMAFAKADAEELFALAKEKNCVLMEGIKTAYCPGFQALLEVARSGKIGDIVDVEACFTRITQSNVRELWDTRYGGSFTEFGSYTLLPIVKLLGTNDVDCHTWSCKGKTGVDVYTKTSFDFGNATALAKTGLAVKSEGQLVIAGTKGYILAPSPWWLTKYFEVRYEDSTKIEKQEFPYEGQGLRYEVQEFVERICSMDKSCETNVSDDVQVSLTVEESIWFAKKMEEYLAEKTVRDVGIEVSEMPNIWAHRGCSLAYPENTLSAFQAAAEIQGITGIELDIQLTKDNVMVVIHDETVDRTTNGSGNVRDFTLVELKELKIAGRDGATEHIPAMEEVFQLLKKYCFENGLLINIELKNSKVRYEGMEQMILEMVQEYGLEDYVIYSSFLPESMQFLKLLNPNAKTGILGSDEVLCRQKMKEIQADAIHPWIGGLSMISSDESKEKRENACPVRVWNTEEPFFGQDRILREKNMLKYSKLGTTDVITNVPELYLKRGKNVEENKKQQ